MRIRAVHLVRWVLPLALMAVGAVIVWRETAEGVGESLIGSGPP